MNSREETLKLYSEMSSNPDMTPEQEYEFYISNAIRTKETLLETIQEAKEYLCVYMNDDNNMYRRSEIYYAKLNELFDVFYREVESRFLMEPLDNWWGYGILVSETGISLMLFHMLIIYDEYIESTDKYPTKGLLVEDEEYVLHTTAAKLLTLEDFGKTYNVSGNTVRQWIRRGKIKNAIKFGKDWRISELSGADKKRKSTINIYSWKEKLSQIPDGYPDINEYAHATISGYGNKWQVIFGREGEAIGDKTIRLTVKEKEKLELYMIANPLILCSNNYCGEIKQRHPQVYKTLKRKEIELSEEELRGMYHV